MIDLNTIYDPSEKPSDGKMKLLFINGLGGSITSIHGYWDSMLNKWYRRDDLTIINPKGWSNLNEWPKQQGIDTNE